MQTTRVQVQLLDVDPPVLRVLDVPAASTLDEVHQLLQAGMGWTDSHPRVVVRAVHDQRPSWYDLGRPASVEDDLRPLVHLHALLREVGLLRLRTGVLHATRAVGDDLAILRRLRSALPEAEFTTVLATAATAPLLTHGPMDVGALARRLRPELGPGWSSGGRALTVEDVTTELYRVLPLLAGLDQVVRDQHTWSAGPSARTLFPRVTLLATHRA